MTLAERSIVELIMTRWPQLTKQIVLLERSGWGKQTERSFESFLEAVDYYKSLE